MPKKPAQDFTTQFELIRAEHAYRRDSQARRFSAAETIAGLTVGSSAVLVGLVADGKVWDWLTSLSVSPLVGAALFGIAVLYPRDVEELDPSFYRRRLLQANAFDAQYWMIDQVQFHIEGREVVLRRRFRYLRIGLTLLTIGILTTIVESALV